MIEITLNGEKRRLDTGLTVGALLSSLDFDVRSVALERNLEIVPRSKFGQTIIEDGDQLELVHFIGGGNEAAVLGGFVVAGKTYHSRLIVGTGKYKDFKETAAAISILTFVQWLSSAISRSCRVPSSARPLSRTEISSNWYILLAAATRRPCWADLSSPARPTTRASSLPPPFGQPGGFSAF